MEQEEEKGRERERERGRENNQRTRGLELWCFIGDVLVTFGDASRWVLKKNN